MLRYAETSHGFLVKRPGVPFKGRVRAKTSAMGKTFDI